MAFDQSRRLVEGIARVVENLRKNELAFHILTPDDVYDVYHTRHPRNKSNITVALCITEDGRAKVCCIKAGHISEAEVTKALWESRASEDMEKS